LVVPSSGSMIQRQAASGRPLPPPSSASTASSGRSRRSVSTISASQA
jgi:hypothetical protein